MPGRASRFTTCSRRETAYGTGHRNSALLLERIQSEVHGARLAALTCGHGDRAATATASRSAGLAGVRMRDNGNVRRRAISCSSVLMGLAVKHEARESNHGALEHDGVFAPSMPGSNAPHADLSEPATDKTDPRDWKAGPPVGSRAPAVAPRASGA